MLAASACAMPKAGATKRVTSAAHPFSDRLFDARCDISGRDCYRASLFSTSGLGSALTIILARATVLSAVEAPLSA